MSEPLPQSVSASKHVSRLDTLKAKKAAIEKEIARLNAAETKERRKLDTRKKILAGAVVLEEAARNEKVADWLHTQLDRGLKSPRDRAVFGLPPLPNSPAKLTGSANDNANSGDESEETHGDEFERPGEQVAGR